MPKGIYNRTPEILAKLKNNFGKEVGFSYWKGKHRSEDTKEKLKEYRTGKKHSIETIEKMKVSRKKRLSSGMKESNESVSEYFSGFNACRYQIIKNAKEKFNINL